MFLSIATTSLNYTTTGFLYNTNIVIQHFLSNSDSTRLHFVLCSTEKHFEFKKLAKEEKIGIDGRNCPRQALSWIAWPNDILFTVWNCLVYHNKHEIVRNLFFQNYPVEIVTL